MAVDIELPVSPSTLNSQGVGVSSTLAEREKERLLDTLMRSSNA
jgi:hypothetical protein